MLDYSGRAVLQIYVDDSCDIFRMYFVHWVGRWWYDVRRFQCYHCVMSYPTLYRAKVGISIKYG